MEQTPDHYELGFAAMKAGDFNTAIKELEQDSIYNPKNHAHDVM